MGGKTMIGLDVSADKSSAKTMVQENGKCLSEDLGEIEYGSNFFG